MAEIPQTIRTTFTISGLALCPGEPTLIETAEQQDQPPRNGFAPTNELLCALGYLSNEYSIAVFGDPLFDLGLTKSADGRLLMSSFQRSPRFEGASPALEMLISHEAWVQFADVNTKRARVDVRQGMALWQSLVHELDVGQAPHEGAAFIKMLSLQAHDLGHIPTDVFEASITDSQVPNLFPSAPTAQPAHSA